MNAKPSLELAFGNSAQRSTREKFHTVLCVTQAVGRAGAILGTKAASDIAAQTLKALKILEILQTETAGLEEDSIPASIANSVQQFTSDLNCALSYFTQLAKQPALHKFIRRNSIRRALERFVTLVEDARSNFLLSQLGDIIYARRITQHVESLAVAVRRDGLRLVRRHELALLGGFRDSDYELVSVQGERKLAKQYRSLHDMQYEVDLSVFRRLNHANLPQIFGVAEDGMAPMILFHLPVSNSNRDLMSLLRGLFSKRKLWKLQPVLVRMCHDFQAALMYLDERHIKWTNSSVASPANMFIVNENGRFVLTGGAFSNLDGQPDRQGSYSTLLLLSKIVNSATTPPQGHADVLSRKLLDWVFLTERPFEPCHARGPHYGFPPMTVDDALMQPSCALRSYYTSWLGATSFTSSIPCQPGDILLVLNYAIPDVDDKTGLLPIKLCNILAHFGGCTELVIDSPEMQGVPSSIETLEDPLNMNNNLLRSLFQGVKIISRHTRRKRSILHSSGAYSRYCGIVRQIARLFGVREDELALVTECTAYIRYNAFFNRRKDRSLSTPDIYLFEPQDMSYMPYWSFLPDPDSSLGSSNTAGFSTECWIEKYHVGLVHLELGDLGSTSASNPDVDLDGVMVDVATDLYVTHQRPLSMTTAENPPQAFSCE